MAFEQLAKFLRNNEYKKKKKTICLKRFFSFRLSHFTCACLRIVHLFENDRSETIFV
jgi:hypothetical protein